MVSSLTRANTEPEDDTEPAPDSVSSNATVSRDLPAPLLAGRYELLGLLGVGGMGSVYRAHDRELDELVAVKMLRKELVSAPGILERFRREVKLARRVTHRNVARVFDIGEHEGEKFLTMELIDGESLGARITREGALPFPRVAEIAAGICAGLAGAHAAGVVHRDLKPDNVLIASDGRVVLTDFGIARAFSETGAGSTLGLLVGTPAYMAPEQVEGRQDVDALADVYALGVVLYELLTGRRAWPGGAPLAVATARLVNPPPDPRQVYPAISSAVSALVLKCMARRREDRYPSMEAIVAALDTIAWTSLSAPPPPRSIVPPPAVSQSRLDRIDRTVAVLPFRNAGPTEDAYLAEELTDDLIDSLSMTRGLKVRSRIGVLSQRSDGQDAREIGRDLGVQVVIEGSVRRGLGRVRISARLISVADGFQLWAKRFERPEQDVLAINDEAAQAIAAALTLDRDAPTREAPSSPEAVDLYLRARHEYRKFWQENQEQALALFGQAESLAPGDPLILSGKALALSRLAFFTGRVEDAFIAAEQAVAVAPNLGEAHLALGAALLQRGDWKPAVRELRSAIGRAPSLADAHGAVGRVLLEVGDLDEAVRRIETALALDPRTPLAFASLARCHALRRSWSRVDEALAQTRHTKKDITYWTIRARLLLWKRDPAAAEIALAELLACEANIPMARLLYEVVARRRLPDALSDRPSLVPETPGNARRRMFMTQIDAEILAYLGDDIEPVISRVARIIDDGFLDIGWMDGCPMLDAVRGDPRFPPLRALVKQRADEILEAYRAG